MRLLFISHLYPSSVEPDRAPYNRQLVRALAGRAAIRIIAPVFSCPPLDMVRSRRLPPLEETLDGILVQHPRVPYVPGVAVHHHWRLYRRAVRKAFAGSVRDARPDHVVLGFAYPDAVAMAGVCDEAGISWSLRVNGSDVRIRLQQDRFRPMVQDVLRRASLVFCPGKALQQNLLEAGVTRERAVVFQNGVDTQLFKPDARETARRRLAETEPRLPFDPAMRLFLCIGNHEHVKGQDRLLDAWRCFLEEQPDDENAVLALIGTGSETARLKREIRRNSLEASVLMAGARSHAEVPLWLNAADALCLPSRSEGTPNVVLEAFACGVPAVAADVGEVPFLVRSGMNGLVVPSDAADFPEQFARAMRAVTVKSWDRKDIRATVVTRTWDEAADIFVGRLGGLLGCRLSGC